VFLDSDLLKRLKFITAVESVGNSASAANRLGTTRVKVVGTREEVGGKSENVEAVAEVNSTE
jgi:hypothetical protein